MALRFVPARPAPPLLAVGLLAFGAAETRSVFRTMATTQLGPPGDDVGAQYRASWIDEALPGDARVAMLPELPIETPPGDRNVNNMATTTLWWDTEFWNKRVADAYVPENDQNADQSPFPKRVLHVDERSGRIEVSGLSASDQARYVVLDTQRADMRPEGRVVESTPWGLELIDAERPYRTAWAAFGLTEGDAVGPGTPVRIRVFENAPARVTVSVVVPFQSTAEPIERRFLLSYGGRTVRRTASSGETRSASVCVQRSGDTAVLRLAPSPDDGRGHTAREHAGQAARAGPFLSGDPTVTLPSITIVTPCLNAADTLEECLASVREQGYPRPRARGRGRWLDRRDAGDARAPRRASASSPSPTRAGPTPSNKGVRMATRRGDRLPECRRPLRAGRAASCG